MDAPNDKDVKLQRQSADLLLDFECSLPKFLWKPPEQQGAPQLRGKVQTRVTERETDRLISLLEPFQEWPQLLDPHLSRLLPPLVAAFIASLTPDVSTPTTRQKATLTTSHLPVRRAVCRLIYTLCKIRGEKVTSRFFNNEPKHLEPMLSAFEASEPRKATGGGTIPRPPTPLIWEERYVMMLWLSHLLLAPFDLVSISSTQLEETIDNDVPGLRLPPNLPGVASRVLSLCLKYLGVASKERQSAKALLVRLVLRPDMRRLDLLHALVNWALNSFSIPPKPSARVTIYLHVGILSFVAGVLASADHNVVAPYILPISRMAKSINQDDAAFYQGIRSSALTRKLLIKISRDVAIFTLQPSKVVAPSLSDDAASSILEDTIDFLLSSLADKDTPVRYAASKALSMITLKLDSEMATEVVEAVVGSLAEDVLWEADSGSWQLAQTETANPHERILTRDLTAVNPLRWHGLTLTLAHLLFRRSPPPEQLPAILNSLILALEFEQRSPTGSSVGTNVRDAACFGIWALSRRYTTQELQAVNTLSIAAANRHGGSVSVPQVLATELLVAASFDLQGNIRRGASAALQELIGRHPDTIEAGIPLVQVVDYHAVALRARAITEVALNAARLSQVYWNALFDAILDWRGIGCADVASRRAAANGVGLLSTITSNESSLSAVVGHMISKLSDASKAKHVRRVEERHGLFLALAAVLDEAAITVTDKNTSSSGTVFIGEKSMRAILGTIESVTDKDLTSAVLRPELTAEAACQLISSTAQVILNDIGRDLSSGVGLPQDVIQEAIETSIHLLSLSLSKADRGVLGASSEAARKLFMILTPPKRSELVQNWISRVTSDITEKRGTSGRGFGHLNALGTVFSSLGNDVSGKGVGPSSQQQLIIDALISSSRSPASIECRVVAIKNLNSGVVKARVLTPEMVETLERCLDDYTIDSRGDVGSWVRLEAIDAVLAASKQGLLVKPGSSGSASTQGLMSRVTRLAAEKLDKVRFRAWLCVRDVILLDTTTDATSSNASDTSSRGYFKRLLSLLQSDYHWIRIPLLEGLVTSAGVGSESVLKASRWALADVAEDLRLGTGKISYTLLDLCEGLKEILEKNLGNDRVLLPALEVLAFLFDVDTIQSLEHSDFKWRSLLILVQKSHFKTGNVVKLEAAVKVYAGLAEIEAVRGEVLSKLIKMLLHPFPTVRDCVADVLYTKMCLWGAQERYLEALRNQDWSSPPKDLKKAVGEIEAYTLG